MLNTFLFRAFGAAIVKWIATFIVFFTLYVVFLGPGTRIGLWLGYIGPHFSIDARGMLGGLVSMPIGFLGAGYYFRKSRNWPATCHVGVISAALMICLVLRLSS